MTKSKRAARARAKKKQLTRARILRAEGRSKGKKNYAKINVTTHTLEQSVELLAHGQRAPVEVKGK